MNFPIARLKIPKFPEDTLPRINILNYVKERKERFVFISAGPGYGKTITLSQIAQETPNSIWLSIREEMDLINFIRYLTEAINFLLSKVENELIMPNLNYSSSASILLNKILCFFENYKTNLTLFIDDIHYIRDGITKDFIANLIKYSPENLSVIFASREAFWKNLSPIFARNYCLELTQKDLAFSRNEIFEMFHKTNLNKNYIEKIYQVTEGWCIAVSLLYIMANNDELLIDIPALTKDKIYPYFYYECLSTLPADLISFLFLSSAFIDLDENMLNHVLESDKCGQFLKSLFNQNIFINKIDEGVYRYNEIFKSYLIYELKEDLILKLQNKAALYYLNIKQYEYAAKYAIKISNNEIIQEVILACYKDYIRKGRFNTLNNWFNTLVESEQPNDDILVAKGVFLSAIGNFIKADAHLDNAISKTSTQNKTAFIYLMIHKARVLRNIVSFEESDKLLDYLLSEHKDLSDELAYLIIIEKLYNYCWLSKVDEAYALITSRIKICLINNSLKVKSWYERYLSVIHFFAGKISQSIFYFEKSLTIPEEESYYFDMHNVGIYAAKAYQIAGNTKLSLELINSEIISLESNGLYGDLWAAYLFKADICFINWNNAMMSGETANSDEMQKCSHLAYEHALVYRKTDFHKTWIDMHQLVNNVLWFGEPVEKTIKEIEQLIPKCCDLIKTLTYYRISVYFFKISDFENSERYLNQSILIGRQSNLMYTVTVSYFMLSRIALIKNDLEAAKIYIKLFFQLCIQNGSFYHLKLKSDITPIIEFALQYGIDPRLTAEIIKHSQYTSKKIYIETLGGFAVFPYNDRTKQYKMKSKKERELFAFLLSTGSHGATKEQIYNAIWFDSNCEDVKGVIAVNLTNLKNDFSNLGTENIIIKREKHYSIYMDEIEMDIDIVDDLYLRYKQTQSPLLINKILDLYRGEYLSDYEALWSIPTKLKYQQIYDELIDIVGKSQK